jgi:hypothetical protein
MTTNPTNGTGQVPPASQSPDSNGQVPPVSQVSTPTDNGDTNGASESSSTLTLEQLQDRNKKLAAENAKRRVDEKRLAELEAKEQQQKDAELSDKERYEKDKAQWQQEKADLLRQSQERIVRSDIKSAAAALGIKPELAYKLLDYAAIDYGEDGDPTNVAELLAAAVQELLPAASSAAPGAPATQRQPSAPQTGATNPPRGTQVTGPNGNFGRDEFPRVTDSRLWKRGR